MVIKNLPTFLEKKLASKSLFRMKHMIVDIKIFEKKYNSSANKEIVEMLIRYVKHACPFSASVPMRVYYDEIDKCLDQYDGQQAYQLIKEMMSKDKALPNAELQYRLAHACYILSNFCHSDRDKCYRLLEEAYASCKSAYESKVKSDEILKWCAVITGVLAELQDLSDFDRITYLREFKKFLDEALTGKPDASVYHMNGRFRYRVRHSPFHSLAKNLFLCEFNMATLSEDEKKSVLAAFGTVPICTIDEALENFHKAEEFDSENIDNLIYLGKCYIAKGNESKAQKYLVSILKMQPADEVDEILIAEARELMTNIKEYNTESFHSDSTKSPGQANETKSSTDSTSSYSEEESDVTDQLDDR
uniref:TPR_REGION domain-containing protein n=1 Tax=Elaeophora elaphi TaxID=1147741 RepID=A0A0R3RZA5_9BILA